MANKVFISFRFSDGNDIKEKLVEKFDNLDYTISKSEVEDRSSMSESTIQSYLYAKLRDTSITVVLLTPEAVDHHRDGYGKMDDWMYDEIRYSLADRSQNRTNAMLAVYTTDAKAKVIVKEESNVTTIASFDNLVRRNMFNVKSSKKVNPTPNLYDSLEDQYISLISLESFLENPSYYIDNALSKRDRIVDFELCEHM
ncbi:MAG: molecular chaperone Tir [Lacticaseibacillus rhamnosus]|nr:molecular chaperone Tir [Lacticaseibacillus rhamnosus]